MLNYKTIIIIFCCSFYNNLIVSQIEFLEFNLGYSSNPNLLITPNEFRNENVYSYNPIANIKYGCKLKYATLTFSIGYQRISNVFPYDKIGFTPKNRPVVRPEVSVDGLSYGLGIEKQILPMGSSHNISMFGGVHFNHYFTYNYLLTAPMGIISIEKDNLNDNTLITYEYSGQREASDWIITLDFGLNYTYLVNEKYGLIIKLGGRYSQMELIQNRIYFHVKSSGVNASNYYDIKNTGSFLYSMIGLRYLIKKSS